MGERAGAAASERYCRTRAEAADLVEARLLAHVEAGRRVLVGFDFPYGYPAGLAAALGERGRPWRAVWDRIGSAIEDDSTNANNRFAVARDLNIAIGGGPGPFWGGARPEHGPALTRSMRNLFAYPFPYAGGDLARLRATERAMGGVQETWKLAGVGSVGSQALVGIPRVRALRDHPRLARVSAVWPFETGFTAAPVPSEGPAVLHAEIWPGIVDAAALKAELNGGETIKDQAQVRLMCRWARDHDAAGALGGYFDPPGLGGSARAAAVAEEGWILGCLP